MYILFYFLSLFLNLNGIPKLKDFSYNKYSQFGEDGIIEKIFSIVPINKNVCLEVGAHNGISMSNTANLWMHKNWKAILIEGDSNNFQKLMENTKGYDCINLNTFIDNKENSIDNLLKKINFEEPIDLISIDIDGNDYYIFENLKIKPTLIIIEYNQTIPHYIDVYQEYSINDWEFGSSIGALNRLAESKGYKLIALTNCNCFFIDEKYYSLFKDYDTNINNIVIYDHLKSLITSFKGEPLIIGHSDEFAFNPQVTGYAKRIKTLNKFYRIDSINLRKERQYPKHYMDTAIDLFTRLNGKTIVELGSIRGPINHDIDNETCSQCNDGHSTLLWARTNAKVYSVDINESNSELVRSACKDYDNVKAITQDGIEFLKNFNQPIDLLYLDAWDVDPGTFYAEKHLEAYLAAKDKLHNKSIILIDDTDIENGGKGKLLIPKAMEDGYKIAFNGRQTMLIK